MNKSKLIIGLALMVTAGIVVTTLGLKLSRNNDEFFTGNSQGNNNECVTVTHSSNEDDKKMVEEHDTSGNDQITENNTDEKEETTNKSENDSDECVTVTQQNDESGVEVTGSEINKIEVNVVEMKEEVSAQISNYDAFLYAIKDCFYKTGVMETEVTSLNKVTHDYNDNFIYFSMYVKSQTLTYFDVTYDLSTGSYYVLMD